MKVLCVHNYYGSETASGENIAFECDVQLLKAAGHRVVPFTSYSDVLRAQGFVGCVRGALSCIRNPVAERKLLAVIHAQHPDVMHVHNVFPRLSPAIFTAT